MREKSIGEINIIATIIATMDAIIIIKKKLQSGFLPPRALLIPANKSITEAMSAIFTILSRNGLIAPTVTILNSSTNITGK